MATILQIVATPRSESYTQLAGAFFDGYRQARPNDRIRLRTRAPALSSIHQ
jgi:hypothetical protein